MSLSLVSLVVHLLLPACLHSLTRHESNHHPLSLPKSINHQSTYSHYSLLPYRYFSREPSGVVSSWQVGVIRTNCMDNLDRTNVVQSLFARRSLLWQLNKAEAKDVMNTPYVFCYTMSLLPSFLFFLFVMSLSLSIYCCLPARVHSLTRHDTSLTIIPSLNQSINQSINQSTQSTNRHNTDITYYLTGTRPLRRSTRVYGQTTRTQCRLPMRARAP